MGGGCNINLYADTLGGGGGYNMGGGCNINLYADTLGDDYNINLRADHTLDIGYNKPAG